MKSDGLGYTNRVPPLRLNLMLLCPPIPGPHHQHCPPSSLIILILLLGFSYSSSPLLLTLPPHPLPPSSPFLLALPPDATRIEDRGLIEDTGRGDEGRVRRTDCGRRIASRIEDRRRTGGRGGGSRRDGRARGGLMGGRSRIEGGLMIEDRLGEFLNYHTYINEYICLYPLSRAS